MPTQKDRVLDYLKEHRTITSLEAMEKLDIIDLQKAIQLLRDEGINITDEWVKKDNLIGRRIRFKKYKLEKEEVENGE